MAQPKKRRAPRRNGADPRKKLTGRPTKFNEETIATILRLLRIGMQPEGAAMAAGVSKPTLYAWLKAGKDDKSYGRISKARMRAFSDAFYQAIAQAEAHCLSVLYDASEEGHYRAAQWLLERRFPERWAKRSQLDVTVGTKPPVQVWTPRADVAQLMDVTPEDDGGG